MQDSDLLQSIRLWTSDGRILDLLTRTLSSFQVEVDDDYHVCVSQLPTAEKKKLRAIASTAAGGGLLQKALTDFKQHTEAAELSEALVDLLHGLSWPDLMFVAACVERDETANSWLLALVESRVLPSISQKWGRDWAIETSEELPQKLHLIDDQGLNRGRPRLLAYGGRSRLITWLKAVASRLAIDSWRQRQRVESNTPMEELDTGRVGGNPSQEIDKAEDMELVRRVIPQAFKDLMLQLPTVSEQQYRFAYFRCVRQWDASAIAKELGVGKSRVTELSQQVFRRLMAIAKQLAPELERATDEPSKERRRWFEEAIGEWFAEDSARVNNQR